MPFLLLALRPGMGFLSLTAKYPMIAPSPSSLPSRTLCLTKAELGALLSRQSLRGAISNYCNNNNNRNRCDFRLVKGCSCAYWIISFDCHKSSLFSSCWVLCEFIHSGHFYSASSSPLLFRSTPNTARILCRSFTPKCYRQL